MSMISEEFIQKAIADPSMSEKCFQLHPGISCNHKMIKQFLASFKGCSKMYLIVHLIPFILFKRKKFRQQPLKELRNFLKGFIKSLLFASFYTLIVRRTTCFVTKHYKYAGFSGGLGGLLGGLALMFESYGRQSEIALFCLNKSIETAYNMGLRRQYPIRIPHGEVLVAAVAFGMLCYLYKDCPNAVKDGYRKVLDLVIGNI